ncbi:MAG: mechanosensitive ion channel family protein [Candidatus Omnitrophica bacterium]|nr:mechanosensitive ion channel family protein [Candidatus Omnitrophota bacterium]
MEQLNTILNLVIYQNTVQSYAFAIVTFLGLILGLSVFKKFLIKYLTKLAQKTTNHFDDIVVTLLSQIGLSAFSVISLYFATLPLILPESLRVFIRYALVIVVTIRSVLILQEIVKYGIGKAYRQRMKADDPSIELMVKSISGILRWVIWALAVIFILDNMGVNISTFVAGIGIGGIAVAMASQAILGDAFSALSIFLDKPFEIGDFIILDGDYLGTVEHIGIKTTRIRSLSGEQLVFSNSDLTKSRIKNYKRMQTRRIAFKIGIVYQTPLEKVKKIPQIVKEIITNINDVRLDRVHFQSYGDFSLIYEIVYYVQSSDYNIYMDKQQEINFALMEAFERENIAFAYPTQTLFVKQEA